MADPTRLQGGPKRREAVEMDDIEHRTIRTNGIEMRIAELGQPCQVVVQLVVQRIQRRRSENAVLAHGAAHAMAIPACRRDQ
jgi:hypothetical protein